MQDDEYELDKIKRAYNQVMPFMKIPPDWEIQFCTSWYSGTMARFRVSKVGIDNNCVSIRLADERGLGFDRPSWEMYPYHEESNFRCDIAKMDILFEKIEEELNHQVQQEQLKNDTVDKKE